VGRVVKVSKRDCARESRVYVKTLCCSE